MMVGIMVLSGTAFGGPQPRMATGTRLTDGICGKTLGPSPFHRREATHLLIANFLIQRVAPRDFADDVAEQVTAELRRFHEEELRNPQEFNIDVPEEALEIGRLGCALTSHEQAREAAETLGAQVVLWGQASYEAGARSIGNNKVRVDVKVGKVEAGSGSSVKIGTVEISAPRLYTIEPKATLYRADIEMRQSTPPVRLDDLAQLDLPQLQSTRPFLLVQFALGLHFYDQKNYWLAARFFRKSASEVLAIERNAESFDLILGAVYLHLPDLARSLDHSRRALDRVRGTGTTREATLLNNIGGVLEEQGDYAVALEHYRWALAIDEKALGKDHPFVATDVNNIGSALKEQGDCVGALEHYRRALVVDEKALGKGHPSVAIDVNNIGSALEEQGDYAGALEHYRRALTIDEKVLGKGHPSVAVDVNNIGSVLQSQGNYIGALEHYRWALTIDEKALGKDHPSVATDVNNIGSALEEQGDYAGALEHYRWALAIDEKALGQIHPSVATDMNNIGSALEKQGNYVGAVEHYRQALTIFKQRLGLEHPRTRTVANNLALAMARQVGWSPAGRHGAALSPGLPGIGAGRFGYRLRSHFGQEH